ncbi:hypothetical protein MCRO_0498 [Mycoplasma crocodyli MP145]|uniref:Uncharacterized protein n=1 Tax=Mycoplasma crocodyli (strain ATCC 51981 / MP145) TaxID=512564 RepID=D5E5S8_MYCCM|nr:hypothetical protein MCRO_0498 [Mycoplasma crocodyli MP145]
MFYFNYFDIKNLIFKDKNDNFLLKTKIRFYYFIIFLMLK